MKHNNRKILFLGSNDSRIFEWLKRNTRELDVLSTLESISLKFIQNNNIFFIVSYGYGHIITDGIIKFLPNRIVNLHLSLLPWNRGNDPVFWSVVDKTPKGVSIHYIDEGIDTGDIIIQKEINIYSHENIYDFQSRLNLEVQELFKKNWNPIFREKCNRAKQIGNGSYHRTKDKLAYYCRKELPSKI